VIMIGCLESSARPTRNEALLLVGPLSPAREQRFAQTNPRHHPEAAASPGGGNKLDFPSSVKQPSPGGKRGAKPDAAEAASGAAHDDLISAASHELRAPLAAILGFAQLLDQRWDRLTDKERRHYVDAILKAARRQRRLVDDLAIIGRVGAGDIPIEVQPLQCAPLVQQAVEEARAIGQDQAIATQGPQDLTVRADAGRAVQILVNLMDNATKYSPEGSTVRVKWIREGNMAAITVHDDGKGVPLEDRAHLFTRYGRLRGSAIRAGRSSMGIGLYISRGLARAMGGDLLLESTGPTGSVFKLLLPMP